MTVSPVARFMRPCASPACCKTRYEASVPNYAESAEIVAQGERDDARNARVPTQQIDAAQRNVPGRLIDLIDARQDQLERRSFRADDEIDPASVSLEAITKLRRNDQQQHQHRNRGRQQHDIERGRCFPVAQIGERKTDHILTPSDTLRPINPFMRASWVAISNVDPVSAAASSRSRPPCPHSHRRAQKLARRQRAVQDDRQVHGRSQPAASRLA